MSDLLKSCQLYESDDQIIGYFHGTLFGVTVVHDNTMDAPGVFSISGAVQAPDHAGTGCDVAEPSDPPRQWDLAPTTDGSTVDGDAFFVATIDVNPDPDANPDPDGCVDPGSGDDTDSHDDANDDTNDDANDDTGAGANDEPEEADNLLPSRRDQRVTSVSRWSGREVKALRHARRMSIREFATHLGVSDRMVSKWEAGGEAIQPRQINQAALDTSLSRAAPDVRARFAAAAMVDHGPEWVSLSSVDDVAAMTVKHLVNHLVDGKLMTLVEAGPYVSGHDHTSRWLAGFYLDVYPVTNAEYANFVILTGHRPPRHWPGGVCPEGLRSHPVVMVSRHDAQAYAAWAAKTLPSAEQWEKAARGANGQVFPWGNYATPSMCNVRASRIATTTPVDWYDVGCSPYGVFDMCGNVWEWCSTATYPERCEIKGGAFTSSLDSAAPATFADAPVDIVSDDIGFRCAAAVDQVLELLAI